MFTLRRTNRATLLLALVVMLLGPLLAVAATSADAAARTVGWIRVAHLATGAGAADVRLSPFRGGRTVSVRGVAYGTVSAYQRVPAGLYTLSLVPAGQSTAQAMVRQTVDVKAGSASTVFATSDGKQVTARAVMDDLSAPPMGQARIRLVSAANGVSRVDATVVHGPQLTRDAAFGSVSGYANVPAQTWTVQIAASPRSALDHLRQRVTVHAGGVYTLLVLGGRQGLRLVAARDSAGAATMPRGAVDTGGGYFATSAGAARFGLTGLRAAAAAGQS